MVVKEYNKQAGVYKVQTFRTTQQSLRGSLGGRKKPIKCPVEIQQTKHRNPAHPCPGCFAVSAAGAGRLRGARRNAILPIAGCLYPCC